MSQRERTDIGAETPRGVADALADPIVQALMAADRVAPECVAALMRRVALELHDRARAAEGGKSW